MSFLKYNNIELLSESNNKSPVFSCGAISGLIAGGMVLLNASAVTIHERAS
jgi:hypothetical protein